MPRKRMINKREILPDPRFNSILAAKFINGIMRKGKKSLSQDIFYGALDTIAKKTNEDPLKVFEKAMDHIKPMVEVKSRRVGGSTYQVPVEVRSSRRVSLGIRWLISFAKARGEKSMAAKLSGEILDAANNRGGAVKKREDTHKMAEANKAFAHYRW